MTTCGWAPSRAAPPDRWTVRVSAVSPPRVERVWTVMVRTSPALAEAGKVMLPDSARKSCPCVAEPALVLQWTVVARGARPHQPDGDARRTAVGDAGHRLGLDVRGAPLACAWAPGTTAAASAVAAMVARPAWRRPRWNDVRLREPDMEPPWSKHPKTGRK